MSSFDILRTLRAGFKVQPLEIPAMILYYLRARVF